MIEALTPAITVRGTENHATEYVVNVRWWRHSLFGADSDGRCDAMCQGGIIACSWVLT